MPFRRVAFRVPFRLRVFFRGAFALLALATLALALSVLQEEKQLSWRNYREVFHKNAEQITARLQHPTGQLALLNPDAPAPGAAPLRPLVLPFSAIDFDDKAKAQQAVEMAGCLVRYGPQASLCVAVGNNPAAGGFLYAVGSFTSGDLVEHPVGERDLALAHRVRVQVGLRGRVYRWVAPLETAAVPQGTRPGGKDVRGRLTGFPEDEQGTLANRPDRDFRGWLWQDGRCLDETANCPRRSFFSVRLPVELFRDELYRNPRPVWPPKDLAQVRVHVQVLQPGDHPPLFDSASPDATPPFALADLRDQLLVGEQLRIRRLGPGQPRELITLTKADDDEAHPSRLVDRIVRRLPVEGYDQPLQIRQIIATPLGDHELLLTGDVRGVNRSLGLVATRISWFVGAMLAAIMLTWLAIEVRIIRRITLLTRRAASVKKSVHAGEGLIQLDLKDLRGSDELGLLAGVLTDLMHRVNEDVRREQLRAEQEKDRWHAVGHEIMAPLQSLSALHADDTDASLRYVRRMQQAVRLLYGSASPSEAIESATLTAGTLDLRAFLRHVADNAQHAGIGQVVFADDDSVPLIVQADEYPLEDVITHVLTNAERYRLDGTPIRLTLTATATQAEVRIHNQGPPIAPELAERIFEYGVSDRADEGSPGQRGQGLFVARTYMAKMGGTITAHNAPDGVRFVLTLQRAKGAQP
ncbi:MAG TPA: HAMP domain-containing histidine kinase [Candidatus Aquabacterium excrementipullorum]|nr:HAMP domain-containing histidine kinase [Candidatus Aquabacterium excrementipullorum]